MGAFLLAASLAACGGGGGGGGGYNPPPPGPTPTATATATATPTATPTAPPPGSNQYASSTVPLTTGALTLPGLNGTSGTLTIPANSTIPTSAQLQLVVTTLAPGGVPPLPASIGTGVIYVGATLVGTSGQPATFPPTLSLAFTPPAGSIPAGQNLYAAFFDPTAASLGLQNDFSGPVSSSGSTLTFAGPNANLTFAANAQYWFVVYALAQGATAPTPAPTQSPGTTFTYTGQFAQKTVYAYPSQAPGGGSEPPSSLKYSVTQTVANGTLPNPFGATGSGTSDVRTAETDASSLMTTNSVTDAWLQTSSSAITLLGSVVSQPASAGGQSTLTTTQFTTPPTIDSLPEINGSFGAANSDAGSLAQIFGDGSSYTRTVAAGGSYTEAGTTLTGTLGNGTISIVENTNGSGTITGPSGGGFAPKSFSTPSGTPPVITIAYVVPSPAPTFLVPFWWPSTTPSFYSEAGTIVTGVVPPPPCAGNANKVARIVTQLDTIIGYTETTEYDTYDTPNGPTCLVMSDTLNSYYDWSGDAFIPNRFSSNGAANPLSTTTTTQTLALSPNPGIAPFMRRSSLTAPIPAAFAAGAAAAAQARFEAQLNIVRARVLKAALARLSSGKGR